MSVFAWRRRATRHFGEHWVPFAELRRRSPAGRCQTFSVRADTGAVISVPARSAADPLAIQLSKGEPIDLSLIGAQARERVARSLFSTSRKSRGGRYGSTRRLSGRLACDILGRLTRAAPHRPD